MKSKTKTKVIRNKKAVFRSHTSTHIFWLHFWASVMSSIFLTICDLKKELED